MARNDVVHPLRGTTETAYQGEDNLVIFQNIREEGIPV